MYETISPITASSKKYLDSSVHSKTFCGKSSSNSANLDDDVFNASEREPTPTSASNLDSHPRAKIIREGFYQAPRLPPKPDKYDLLPSCRVVPKKTGKSLSASDRCLSSSSISVNQSPVTTQKQ